MDFDALLLSRLQFAFVVAFHILFPAFTIGMATFLAICEGLWLATKKDVYRRLYLHWVKIFALAFAMGVVSGVVMSYQFGTNWSVFSDRVGSVMGPLLGYEVLTAFFLEATFLGVMLFGWNRVGKGLHFFATCAVAVGTTVSAFWILSANSWMQTPAGFAIDPATGNFYATDWMAVIFNPSFPSRMVHMILAAWLTAAGVIFAAGAYQVLRGRVSEPTKAQLRMAAVALAAVMPLQIWAGHWSGEVAEHHQPAKIAAMEGWWTEEDTQDTVLFAWPDETAERNHAELAIPGLSQFLFASDALPHLSQFAPEDRPPVAITFWSFRIMVGAGLVMLLIGIWGLINWARGRLDRPGLLHFLGVAGVAAPFVAVLTGWIVAEVGRQPFTVYGVLRTSESVSPVSAEQVATSLLAFMIVYAIVFTAGVVYMARIAIRGFGEDPAPPPASARRAPGSPLGAVDEPAEAPASAPAE